MKRIFLFIFLISALCAQTKNILSTARAVDASEKMKEEFASNKEYIQMMLLSSNRIESNVISNSMILLDKLLRSDLYSQNAGLKYAFYDEAAHFMMDKDGQTPSSRIKAEQLWISILQADIDSITAREKEISSSPKKADTNFNLRYYLSPANALVPGSLKMQRYFHQQRAINHQEDPDFNSICLSYSKLITKGMRPAVQLSINLALWYLEQADTNKEAAQLALKTLADVNQTEIPDGISDMLELKLISGIEDGEELSRRLLLFYKKFRSRDYFNSGLDEKYFNAANSLVFYRVQGKDNADGRYLSMSTNVSDQNTALEYYSKALEIRPKFPECWYNKALIYCKQDRIPLARQSMREALKLKTAPDMIYLMGLVEMRLGNWDDAGTWFREANIYFTNKELLNNMAVCALKSEKNLGKKPVLRLINQAMDLDDKDYRLYVTRAQIHKKFGDDSAFTNDIKNAIEKLNKISADEYIDWVKAFQMNSTNSIEIRIAEKTDELKSLIYFSMPPGADSVITEPLQTNRPEEKTNVPSR